MRPADLVERPWLLVPAAIALQWLTTAAAALRADDVSIGWREAVQVALLAPLALTLAYVVAARVAGPALGAWTTLVWVATPWLAYPVTLASYDATLRNEVLPLVLGLRADAGFLEGVAILAVLASALLATRTTLLAGGVVLAVLALVWARRAAEFPDLSWDVLQAHSGGLREYFWSQRVLQWLPLAGAIGVARRAPLAAAALLAWLVAYVALRSAQPGTSFEDGQVFRELLPALPAYVLLAAAVPLLVPTLAERLGRLAAPRRRAAPAPPAAPPAAPGSRSDPTAARARSSNGAGPAG